MRGIATVLTIAFVFASSALMVGPALAQSTEPSSMPPEEYRADPTDAVIAGRVLDKAGNPIAGATVSSSNYGPIYYLQAEGDSSGGGSAGSPGVASDASRPSPYYGGNSTTSGADGSFRLGVYSGDNTLSAYRDGYASASLQVSVGSGQTVDQDLTLQKFPDKTARIEGRITDARTGRGLPTASISVSSPLYGTYECSQGEGDGSGGGEPKPMPAEDASSSIVAPDYDPYPGCSITLHSDGRFDGLVTPGYSIVSVYAYSECSSSSDADGSSSSSCGPQYFGWSRSLDLPANKTTVLNAALRSHAAPDAVVSGYILDSATGEGIAGAQVSFSNQETYGYGWATTDGDGSYSIRLRSGYHMVSVYAPGHLPWESTLDVKSGDSDLDVKLIAGEPSYGGGCCWAYDSAGVKSGAAQPPTAAGMAGSQESLAADDGDGSTEEVLYQDLGGGLGPYDASERQDALADDGAEPAGDEGGLDIPGPGLVLALAALGAVLLLRRRTA